jgi:hypothetical protein
MVIMRIPHKGTPGGGLGSSSGGLHCLLRACAAHRAVGRVSSWCINTAMLLLQTPKTHAVPHIQATPWGADANETVLLGQCSSFLDSSTVWPIHELYVQELMSH